MLGTICFWKSHRKNVFRTFWERQESKRNRLGLRERYKKRYESNPKNLRIFVDWLFEYYKHSQSRSYYYQRKRFKTKRNYRFGKKRALQQTLIPGRKTKIEISSLGDEAMLIG